MCEILVFARNNTNPDPEKDRRGCYKRGDPVLVFEDGHTWGREESKQQWISEGNPANTWPNEGKFLLFKLPGIPAEKALEMMSEQMEDDSGTPTFSPVPLAEPLPQTYRRRRWWLDIDSLTTPIKNALATDGEFTFSKPSDFARARSAIKRKRDNAQYNGLD